MQLFVKYWRNMDISYCEVDNLVPSFSPGENTRGNVSAQGTAEEY